MIDLSGKPAVVIGSTGDVGFAAADRLLEAGAAVTINGRTQQAVDNALGKLRDGYPDARVRGITADLATAEGCDTLIAAEPAPDILGIVDKG